MIAQWHANGGFSFDMTKGSVGWIPPGGPETFRCFWCLQSAWGTFALTKRKLEVKAISGAIRIQRLASGPISAGTVRSVTLAGEKVAHVVEKGAVRFAAPVTLEAGGSLVVSF